MSNVDESGTFLRWYSDRRAVCSGEEKGDPESLRMHQLENGMVILKSLKTGRNLQVRPDGSCHFKREEEETWEQLTLEVKGDKYFFIAHNGNAL